MAEYDDLDLDALKARLAAAEDVCRMFGWSAARNEHDRDKAAYMLWSRWCDLAGERATDPRAHPHLNDAAVFALATERDLIRHTTLRHFFGDDVGE